MLSFRRLFALIIAVIAGVAALHFAPEPLPELTRAEFLDEVRAGHVRGIEIEDQEVIIGESTTRGRFRSDFSRARDVGLPDELRSLGIEAWFTRSPPGI